MSRCNWHDLPTPVKAAVERLAGAVVRAVPIETGSVSDLVNVLHTAEGPIFCKAVTMDNPLGWMHRNEARLNVHLPDVAPRLLWQVEVDRWLVLGFEHVGGRHPDLAVGSPDLGAVAETLTVLGSKLTPCPPVRVQPASARWAGRIAPELVEGDTLLHTDVTPRNFLVTGSTALVVDWSMPCRGARWIDTALMVVRLVRAGHSPAQAEVWAEQVPAWSAAHPHAVTAFAAATAELTRERHQQSGAAHLASLAAAADVWRQWRLQTTTAGRHSSPLSTGKETGNGLAASTESET